MIILREKVFARRDYEGLSEEGKAVLEAKRKSIAHRLRQARNSINQDYKDHLFQNRLHPGDKPEELEAANKQATKFRNKRYQIALDNSREISYMNREGIMRDYPKSGGKKSNTNHNTTSHDSKPKPKPQTKEVTEGFLKRNWNKLGTGGKVAAIGVPIAAAAIGTGLAIKKHNDKKNK